MNLTCEKHMTTRPNENMGVKEGETNREVGDVEAEGGDFGRSGRRR